MTLSKKYPEEYFNHWLAMFCASNSVFDEKSVKEKIEMYKNFEGEEELSELKIELNSIIKNDDLEEFIEVSKSFGWEKAKNIDLIGMAKIINNG